MNEWDIVFRKDDSIYGRKYVIEHSTFILFVYREFEGEKNRDVIEQRLKLKCFIEPSIFESDNHYLLYINEVDTNKTVIIKLETEDEQKNLIDLIIWTVLLQMNKIHEIFTHIIQNSVDKMDDIMIKLKNVPDDLSSWRTAVCERYNISYHQTHEFECSPIDSWKWLDERSFDGTARFPEIRIERSQYEDITLYWS